MIMSTLKDSPGYVTWLRRQDRKPYVYLDGHLVRDVFEASEEDGYVLVYLRDPDHGGLAYDRRQDQIPSARLEGRVHISLLPWFVSTTLVATSYSELK